MDMLQYPTPGSLTEPEPIQIHDVGMLQQSQVAQDAPGSFEYLQ